MTNKTAEIFELSSRAKEIRNQLLQFMDEHIYPNENAYYPQDDSADRWKISPYWSS